MNDDAAKARFYLIAANRLFGAIMVLVAILAIGGTIALDDWFSYALLVVGGIEFFVVPQILARAWRSPRE